MTESQRTMVRECLDATLTHFNAIDNLDTGLASDMGLDGIAEGLAITESKLRSLLQDDVSTGVGRSGGAAVARILREIRRKANYETAGFSSFKIPGKVDMDFPFKLPFTSDELTSAIKETTRLYRESWINPLIDGLIAWTEGKKDIRQIEKDLL